MSESIFHPKVSEYIKNKNVLISQDLTVKIRTNATNTKKILNKIIYYFKKHIPLYIIIDKLILKIQ